MKKRIKFCFWSGLMLVNLGLFLQPMGPGDFFALAVFSPLATLSAYGIQAVLLFWGGIALLLAGLADWLIPRAVGAHPAANEFEDGWAFL